MKTLLLACFLVPLLAACYFCPESRRPVIPKFFTEEQKKAVPYTGKESIVLTDEQNQQIIFEPLHRKISRVKNDFCIECCEPVYDIETDDESVFKSDYRQSELRVAIENDFIPTSKNYRGVYLFFTWIYLPDGKTQKKELYFDAPPLDSMQIVSTAKGLYKEKLALQGKEFEKVYIMPATNGLRLPQPDTLYYTLKQGVIALKYEKEGLWVLE